jgi:hypothetical protein
MSDHLAELFYVAGGAIFIALGSLHLLYTFLDISRPRRLVPDDPLVIEAMHRSSLRLTRGKTSIWNAWVGFNFSHSLGVIWFGASCIVLGLASTMFPLPKHALLAPVFFAAALLWLGVRYWFKVPAIGIAIGTVLLAAGWLVY